MADNITTASPPSSLPPGTIISTQQQTDNSERQNIRLVDGTKDSTNALAIDSEGAAKIQAPPSLPLPTGASTETTLAAILAKIIAAPATAANQTTEITALGTLDTDLGAILAKLTSDPATQTTLAAVLDALQGTLAISASALPLPTGAATAANQATEISGLAAILSDTDAILAKLSSDPATQTTLAAILTKLNASIAVTGTFWQATQPVSAASLPLPSGAATETTLAALKALVPTALGSNGGLKIEGVASGTVVPVQPTQLTSGTATQTSVASSASSVSLLASNAARKLAMIFNDSTAGLYVFFGSSAATTSNFTVQIAAGGYYELPAPVFTGELRGIWASANGNARVTELT